MSFDYDKAKAKYEDSHGNMWTAYSDLFMMLSTVFLLLYVSVSLRTQTSGFEVDQKVKQLTQRNADLEQQIQVYNTLKENHLKTEANDQEREVYEKLMSKLTLLKEEAKDEKEKLRLQAKENENKEYALNEYQRLIRNIINTNILSKTQIKQSDVIIERKDNINQEQKKVIASKEEQIADLNDEIESKQEEIDSNKEKIQKINNDLKRKIALLKQQQEDEEISKSQMLKKIAALKDKTKMIVSSLESQNNAALKELNQVQTNLAKAQNENKQKSVELAQTLQALAGTKAQYEQEITNMKNAFESREGKLRGDFEAALNQEKLTGIERARRMAEFESQAKAREQELAGKINELGSKVNKAEADKGRAMAAVQDLSNKNANLSADLKRAQELANARSELSKNIKSELRKAGLNGDVDAKTGDVTLSFGEEYFDTGSSNLKPSMMNTLKKFMPGYSKSLFSDPKISKNIENVEIIGFASSTFKGRYVPPDSLRPQDREAINYNLKLSFDRANSIFKHIFDTKKMSFEHQRDLLPKIKVVGRGYLPDGKSGTDFPPGMPENEFCKKFNCKKAQKVIIKFKLKD